MEIFLKSSDKKNVPYKYLFDLEFLNMNKSNPRRKQRGILEES